jgi:ribose transport system permease protein
MNMETTKPSQKASSGSRISNETFITLFMTGVLIVIFLIACLVVPGFYNPKNIINILTNNWYIVIIGIGVTFLLITGNFDMSVGGVIAMTGVLSNISPGFKRFTECAGGGLGLPYGGNAWFAVRHGIGGLTHSSSQSSRYLPSLLH